LVTVTAEYQLNTEDFSEPPNSEQASVNDTPEIRERAEVFSRNKECLEKRTVTVEQLRLLQLF
jgi:hypothetical protein